jgi:general secretion pathway protein A
MYLDHFQLREMPFVQATGTRFLHFTVVHREALNHVLFGIRQGKGFIVLTGEVGSGKTTLCRAIRRDLEPRFKTALILNPMRSEVQLLRAILIELGIPELKGDQLVLRERLHNYLLDQAARGNEVVLIIDEAQDLTCELLEHVRLLSNLETETRKLLQIVLVGQPELRQMLGDPRLRQLRQRINVHFHLAAMKPEETSEYVQHRIKVAGGTGSPGFNRAALRLVHEYGGGIPRRINTVCDMAMLAAFGRGERQVGVEAVRAAIDELRGLCQ